MTMNQARASTFVFIKYYFKIRTNIAGIGVAVIVAAPEVNGFGNVQQVEATDQPNWAFRGRVEAYPNTGLSDSTAKERIVGAPSLL